MSLEHRLRRIVRETNKALVKVRFTFKYTESDICRKMYTKYILREFEYAETVWSPYLRSLIELLEMVQRNAAITVQSLSGLSYKRRSIVINLSTLE